MAKKKGLVDSETALMGIAAQLLAAALKKDIAAMRELGDRLDGKANQKVEHSGGVAIYKPDADDAELG